MTARRSAIASALRALADAFEQPDDEPAPVPASDGPELVTSKALGIATRTLRRAGEAGELNVYRVGRELVARRSEALAWLEGRRLNRDSATTSSSLEDDHDIAEAMIVRGIIRRAG